MSQPSKPGTPQNLSRIDVSCFDVKRATEWKLRTKTLQFDRLPAIMGILNVTPDSFSDGGSFRQVDDAIRQAEGLVEQGADILDIGGESTRPYADPVAEAEEIERIAPVLEKLANRISVPISIDTSKAAVARVALDAGAEIINDVTGLERDPDMIDLAVHSGAGICAMHMQGSPQDMQDNPTYDDVVEDVYHYLGSRKTLLIESGIAPSRICLDPGVGFGKEHGHNVQLLAHCSRYHALECPILIGHSRKGFIGKILGDKQRDRAAATAGIAVALAMQGMQVLRVHDVAAVKDAILMFDAVGGLDGQTWIETD